LVSVKDYLTGAAPNLSVPEVLVPVSVAESLFRSRSLSKRPSHDAVLVRQAPQPQNE